MRTVWRAVAVAAAAAWPALACGSAAAVLAAGLAGQGGTEASATTGAALFSGDTALANGGPPCGSCHSIAGLGFPGGGTLGPDLTTTYETFGPDGVAVTLQTLYFPTMAPVFAGRLLTPAEQGDLAAFLKQAGGATAGTGLTGVFALIALVGLLVLLAVVWIAGRGRLRGVRRSLVTGRSRRGATIP